jgi:hypothetical protein
MMPGQAIQVKWKRNSKVYNCSGANLAKGVEGAALSGNEEVDAKLC